MNSSIRKRSLSGWLKKEHNQEFHSKLKLQKFLFFYESLSKIEDNGSEEFRSLKGYVNGPVFSDVYGDYTYEYEDFVTNIEETYEVHTDIVNKDRAKFSGFLVEILNEEELSELTHELNIWNCKRDEIDRGVKHVPLNGEDLNSQDTELLVSLREMYPTEYIDSVKVIKVSDKSFILNNEDIEKITEEQRNVFYTLAEDNTLDNPVYISISDDGVILVD
ncbi:hypothetical protein [Bacillus velezensis]|uniref:hypothetical protein n=1 Tax=Bacillus velezensis TaxID=492670 RepID=UPI0025A950F8|nr:hypothetical protein [Bacillus velezensis]